MAKRFKLKFNIPSFQICRSKHLSSFPGNPVVPAIYRLSPVNTNTVRDTRHPNLPSPSSSNITSIAQGCKMCRHNDNLKKVKSRSRKSTSSIPSMRSNYLIDNIEEEESESLVSFMTSFSDEFCLGEEKDSSSTNNRERRKVRNIKKVQRMRFQSSENRRGAETEVTRSSTVQEKVKESFAMVKKSKDPYQDFKKSMMEMIKEMDMSETEELAQLLQCFLALNSPSHHGVIVRAFMEICQQMFIWNPTSQKNLKREVKIDMKK